MSASRPPALTRRAFLASAAATAAAGLLPPGLRGAVPSGSPQRVETALRAAAGKVRLVPEPYPETPAWCYGGRVPGPEIRVRQGQRLRVMAANDLAEPTTVHWHGVRLPHAMDGVPHLTQPPIEPGGRFVYEFDAVDAGTFWYHPHQRSSEQVGRGLHGVLIVEEPDPLRVDRDLTWVLDDWRLTPEASVSADFGHPHDASHGGRLGNTLTLNGRVPDTFDVRSGERLRLRVVNVANARIFALDFQDLAPVVIAMDGQPVTPHRPADGRVVLGPAMRVDLMLDLTGPPGGRSSVIDRFYPRQQYRLVDLVYGGRPLREHAPDWPVALAPNPLPEPDLSAAARHEIVFNGGMMGRRVMEEMGGNMGSGPAARHDGIWFINGVAARGHVMEPLLTLARDRSHILTLTNATAWHHPMHLHGHSFRVLSRNGQPTVHREWQDTVLMAPRETVDIALVADNPGDWMFHCHILEHQAAGMMGVNRVV